ncbi:hypothetical protein OG892_01715 [Streptomyces sp. NBC_00341]|uniref:hypothetical protein n=1 Tax=unclassified Streptomyces TaxID=2593676 RepID=UPI0030907BDB|nr:hypothetical protein OG892_01715 [Streptomyces sp. NBC_00341]
MTEQAQLVADSWSDGFVIDVDAQMRKLTTATVVKTLFTPAAGAAAETLTAVTQDLLRGIDRRLRNPIRALERLPTPANRRFERAKPGTPASSSGCTKPAPPSPAGAVRLSSRILPDSASSSVS